MILCDVRGLFATEKEMTQSPYTKAVIIKITMAPEQTYLRLTTAADTP